MAKLETIIARSRTSSMSIDKLCKIRTYLPTQEKFKFLEEYYQILERELKLYSNYHSFVAFIFFNLMVVKKYTDIEIEMTYESFDLLQEAGIINKIIEVVQEDYTLLLRMVQMGDEKDN